MSSVKNIIKWSVKLYMGINERNKKVIRDLLIIAIRNKEFVEFVLMMPNYCVETRDLNGFVKPNRYYTMQAIYEYYSENPEVKLDELLYDALIYISTSYKGEGAIENVLEVVKYQLHHEKDGLAPFKIDCQAVLDKLRVTIFENKEMYLKSKEAFDFVPFWNTIEKYNLLFKEKYAHNVL